MIILKSFEIEGSYRLSNFLVGRNQTLSSSYLKSFSPYGPPFLYTSPNCSLPKEESFPFHHEKK